MIPLLQFDPSNLAIWYDVDLLEAFIGGDTSTQKAFDAAISGDIRFATGWIDLIEDRKARARAIVLISSIVHEKQHFFDFVATNYGAMRFRQYSEIYLNLPVIAEDLKATKVLHCPVEVYLDPVKRKVLGIEATPPSLTKLAEATAKRRRMIDRDRELIDSRFGGFEIGGEALLEARAYMVQTAFIQKFFGLEGMELFEEAVFDIEQSRRKYSWIFETLGRSGVLQFEHIEGRAHKTNTNLVSAMVFAALQGSYFGPPTGKPELVETNYPAERLAALIVHLKNNVSVEKLAATNGAIQVVDDACEHCFGRGVKDEIAIDVQAHENFLAGLLQVTENKERERDVNIRILKAFVGCRRRASNLFLHGESLTIYPDLVLGLHRDVIRPRIVISSSKGTYGEPPAGIKKLMGYNGNKGKLHREEVDADFKIWWWASTPEKGNKEFYPERNLSEDTLEMVRLDEGTLLEFRLAKESCDLFIELEDDEVWDIVSDFLAPIAKLMLGGRATRLMLGAEMNYAEQRLKTLTGVDVSVWHSFEYPEALSSSAPLFYYCGKDILKCDFTSQEVTVENSFLVSPWEVKSNKELAAKLLKNMGGSEFALYCLIRDWSFWLISKEALGDYNLN